MVFLHWLAMFFLFSKAQIEILSIGKILAKSGG